MKMKGSRTILVCDPFIFKHQVRVYIYIACIARFRSLSPDSDEGQDLLWVELQGNIDFRTVLIAWFPS